MAMSSAMQKQAQANPDQAPTVTMATPQRIQSQLLTLIQPSQAIIQQPTLAKKIDTIPMPLTIKLLILVFQMELAYP